MNGVQANEKVNVEFDRYASSYDDLLEDPIRDRFTRDPLHFYRRKWLQMEYLLKRASVNASSLRWLDVGCGRGELLELAGSQFASATGCDPSAGMISSASFEVHQQISHLELPFDDKTVDFVTAVCVYHHVPQDARVLLTSEIKRVLTPGGLFCIIEHNPWNPVTRAIVKRCPVDVDAELLTARSARLVLRAGGFEPLASCYFLYLPERLFDRVGTLEKMFSKVPLGGQYALLARSLA
jgi:SAM-dependent methyltransferase